LRGYLVCGNLGISLWLNQAVRELLRDRLPVTLRELSLALLLAWILGLGLAIAWQLFPSRLLKASTEGLSGAFISTPAAALALIFVLLRLPPLWAAALLIFPKIYRYSSNLLHQSYDLPHMLTPYARGAGTTRVVVWHVAP